MSQLVIAGITFPGAADSGSESEREVGSTTPAFDGTLRRSRLSVKLDMRCETTPQTLASAAAWSSLIRGLGEVWSFDSSLYSASGLGPYGSPVYTLASTHPKFGAKNLSLNADTGTLSYAPTFGTDWAVMVWRYETNVWIHYTAYSDGKKWVDGVRNDAATTTFLSVAAGLVTLANTSGSAVEYDDLVFLPFLPPTTWPPVWGVAAVAFSPLPRLNVTGSAITEGGARMMLGQVPDASDVATAAGTRRTLTVTLQQA